MGQFRYETAAEAVHRKSAERVSRAEALSRRMLQLRTREVAALEKLAEINSDEARRRVAAMYPRRVAI